MRSRFAVVVGLWLLASPAWGGPFPPWQRLGFSGSTLPTFSRCSPDQESTVVAALLQARVQAAVAAVGLYLLPEAQRPGSPRFNKWFGAYDKTRWETARDHFNALGRQIVNQSLDFDCGTCPLPSASRFAWVDVDRPYGINLCGSYWALSDTRKAGTLVHEMSHFNVVAGTDDLASNPIPCENLARLNPDAALRNADNYELFAENEPYVPLRADEAAARSGDAEASPRSDLPSTD